MAKSGLKHIDVGNELTKTEWESEESHELTHGTSFPGSPVERQLYYRDDEHKWYIYTGSAWTELTAAGAASTFLGLTDTPSSYSGQAGKYARVNSGEDALEFDTPAGAGDMQKSVYDTDDDGVVDNSEKLEGSTKAQVQDHSPKTHATSHENAGADEINVAGLSGELADAQTPKSHASSHQNGGGDEVSVAGLSGELADLQPPKLSQGLDADKPAAATAGKLYWATDTGILYRDSGSAWAELLRGESVTRLAQLAEKDHGSLTGVGTADHHSNANDPSSDEKDALAGTSGTPSSTNKYVTDDDPRNTNDRDPNAHAGSHQDGGADEVNVAGLSGELADPQPPKAHSLGGSEHNADTLANLNSKVSDATLDDSGDPRDPNAHKSSHENGGSDEISLAGLSGDPADTINESLLTARGDIIYRDASAAARLAKGTEGQFLKQGANDPEWSTLYEVTSTASDSTPDPTGGSKNNEYYLTALATDATFSAPSGTPANGNRLIIRIKDDGTARSLSWNAIYRALEFALPTTTVISKTMYLGFIYNSVDSRWDLLAINEEA